MGLHQVSSAWVYIANAVLLEQYYAWKSAQ